MRADYLNQLNTQATLVGGAAIGLLSSGELTVVNELSAQRIGNLERLTQICDAPYTRENCVFSDFEGEWADRINNYLYMASACGCLASSIWVLYTSTNLVQFGTLAALMPGENAQATEETMRHTDLLIHHRMADVRKMFVFSLVCLIMSVMMMIWEHFEVVTVNFHIALLDLRRLRRPRVDVRRLGRGVLRCRSPPPPPPPQPPTTSTSTSSTSQSCRCATAGSGARTTA